MSIEDIKFIKIKTLSPTNNFGIVSGGNIKTTTPTVFENQRVSSIEINSENHPPSEYVYIKKILINEDAEPRIMITRYM